MPCLCRISSYIITIIMRPQSHYQGLMLLRQPCMIMFSPLWIHHSIVRGIFPGCNHK